MNLECLNDIITDNLAIHIDLTNVKSWDLNTGFTSISLTKWSGAVSDNLDLIDFGLTGFDNGRTDKMWEGIKFTPKDTLFTMYRIGYNVVDNPTSGETSGVTVSTEFDLYPISAITTGASGNYFELAGGYLQGFFKLDQYNYELLPARYNNGITIETLLYLHPNSQGIFYMMGARAEDKYNPYFSGETITGITSTGVTTSFDNYLDAIKEKETVKSGFGVYEDRMEITPEQVNPIENIKNNVIAFAMTEDKKLAYKYINNEGLVVVNTSPSAISRTGFTWITIGFAPDSVIDDPDLLICAEQRKGRLTFYINGRAFWTLKEFPEFFFKSFANDKEKQIGVPYSISWGGGSFGLKHSWHYDYQTYNIYTGQDDDYLNNTFLIQGDPIPNECNPTPSEQYLPGLSLSADSTTFSVIDECNPEVETPLTVMRIEHTGNTATTYFIKFNQPVSVLSNRNYVVDMSVYNDNFFTYLAQNKKITILVYSDTVDVSIIESVEYTKNSFVGTWMPLKTVFRTEENSGQHFVYIGILIESDLEFNLNSPLFVRDFTYTGADILVIDERKDDLLIEQNFDSGFIGGIQKLRIYDTALTSTEVLHNIYWETRNNPGQNIVVSKGGRIIYR
jgi:hypothetical protein